MSTLTIATMSFLLSCILIPFTIHLSRKYGFLDLPTQKHKTHVQPIPNLGGLAIAVSTGFTFFGANQWGINSQDLLLSGNSILLTLVGIVLLGLLDDLKPRSARFRLLIQTAIVFLGVSAINQVVPTNIRFFDSELLNQTITIFFVLSVCNFVNMFDNHDGSASGVSLLILLFISLMAYFAGQEAILSLALCAAASVFAFLIWNFPPAKIYLGDSGSTFLGTIISLLIIQLDFQNLQPQNSILVVLLILGTLELDFSVAVISRIRRRVSPMKGDQSHIAHRLRRMGFAKKYVALIIWSITLWFLILASVALWSDITPLLLVIISSGISFMLLLIFFLKKADS